MEDRYKYRPGKNDVGDWMNNQLYISYHVWTDARLRSKFDDPAIEYEPGGAIAGSEKESASGYWTEHTIEENLPGGPEPDDPPKKSTSSQPQSSPSIFYRGHESPWMLGRGGIISAADYDATMKEKAWVGGTFAGAVIVGIFAEPLSLFLSFRYASYIGKARVSTTNLAAKTGMTSGQLGKIIGWGEGQTVQAVQQTINVTKNLTRSQVQGWAKQGLTKSWVQDQLTKYSGSLIKGGDKLKNTQLMHRKELMEKILELW